MIIPARDPKQVRKILPGESFWRGISGEESREESRRGIWKRNPEEESRKEESQIGIQRGIQRRNAEEESRSEILDRNPAREESSRGIQMRNAGAG